MKLAIIVLSALTIVAVSADSEADAMNALIEMKKACMTKTGATPEEVQSVFDMENPQTRPGQCVAACMAKAIGIMADNKLNMVQIKQMDFESALMSAMEACAQVTDADECTAAMQIMECVKQHL